MKKLALFSLLFVVLFVALPAVLWSADWMLTEQQQESSEATTLPLPNLTPTWSNLNKLMALLKQESERSKQESTELLNKLLLTQQQVTDLTQSLMLYQQLLEGLKLSITEERQVVQRQNEDYQRQIKATELQRNIFVGTTLLFALSFSISLFF